MIFEGGGNRKERECMWGYSVQEEGGWGAEAANLDVQKEGEHATSNFEV